VLPRARRIALHGRCGTRLCRAIQRSFNEVSLLDQRQFQEIVAAEGRASAQLLTNLGL